MRTAIILAAVLTTAQVYAELPVYCIFNHAPASAFADLEVQPLAGGTVFAPFFEDVEGDNTLGVNQADLSYIAMKNRRDDYEAYYDARMSDISDLVDDLNTELTVFQIEARLDSIHTKTEEIDAEYLDAGLDLIDYMDTMHEDLYADYKEYLATLGN